MIGATRLYLAAFGSITALIYQLPHPWGASDGPPLHTMDSSFMRVLLTLVRISVCVCVCIFVTK